MVYDVFELQYIATLIVQLGIKFSSNFIFRYLFSLTILQLYLKFACVKHWVPMCLSNWCPILISGSPNHSR